MYYPCSEAAVPIPIMSTHFTTYLIPHHFFSAQFEDFSAIWLWLHNLNYFYVDCSACLVGFVQWFAQYEFLLQSELQHTNPNICQGYEFLMAKYIPGKVLWREERSSSADLSGDNVRDGRGRGCRVCGTRHSAYQPTNFWNLIL